MSALFICTGLKPQVFLELESLILAQNERWRQVLGMQVERVKQGRALVDLVAHE